MTLKSTFIKSAGFGAGFALASATLIVSIFYVKSLPAPERPWDNSAVTGSFVQLTVTTRDADVAIDFAFSINNTTDRDYRFPNDKDAVFFILPEKNVLYQPNNSPDPFIRDISIDPSLIPAKQHAIVSLHVMYGYKDFFQKSDVGSKDKFVEYVNHRLKRIDGFQIFDAANKFQIALPKGWSDTKSDTTRQTN